jgi:hypothetical protein
MAPSSKPDLVRWLGKPRDHGRGMRRDGVTSGLLSLVSFGVLLTLREAHRH